MTLLSFRRKVPASPMRDPDYLDWLRANGVCSACLASRPREYAKYAIDAAHGPVNGMASKGPDNECIPLCRVHHTEMHEMGWPKFEKRHWMDRKRLAADWFSLYQQECKHNA